MHRNCTSLEFWRQEGTKQSVCYSVLVRGRTAEEMGKGDVRVVSLVFKRVTSTVFLTYWRLRHLAGSV